MRRGRRRRTRARRRTSRPPRRDRAAARGARGDEPHARPPVAALHPARAARGGAGRGDDRRLDAGAARPRREALAGELAALRAADAAAGGGRGDARGGARLGWRRRAPRSARRWRRAAPPAERARTAPALHDPGRDSESLDAPRRRARRDRPARRRRPPPTRPRPAGPAAGRWRARSCATSTSPTPRACAGPGVVDRAPPPLALVSAPADAIVRYAGPFLEYGYVVVLEPDAGDAGGARGPRAGFRSTAGDRCRRGDLLGLMGGRRAGR